MNQNRVWDNQGVRRLSVFVSPIIGIVTGLVAASLGYNGDKEGNFWGGTLLGTVAGWVMVRLGVWVIDGFKQYKATASEEPTATTTSSVESTRTTPTVNPTELTEKGMDGITLNVDGADMTLKEFKERYPDIVNFGFAIGVAIAKAMQRPADPNPPPRDA